VADAFFFPAQTSIVPELVEPEQLQPANGIVQATAQASILVGPALAGLVIAGAGSSGSAMDGGIGLALLIDAASFLASLVTLWLIRPRAHVAESQGSIVESIREGVRFVSGSPALRLIIVLSLTANLFIVGPFEVGVPLIAYTRLPEGAAAFGLVLAAFGGGSLLGLLAGSILPPPGPSRFGPVVILTIGLAGVTVAVLATVHTTLFAAMATAVAGAGLGYGNLISITWIQSRIPPELMGRVMSLLITGSVGLVPISTFVSGIAVQVNLDATMVIAGGGMALLAVASLLSPAVRNLGLALPPSSAPAAAVAGGDASA
jgi:hypothetical protein